MEAKDVHLKCQPRKSFEWKKPSCILSRMLTLMHSMELEEAHTSFSCTHTIQQMFLCVLFRLQGHLSHTYTHFCVHWNSPAAPNFPCTHTLKAYTGTQSLVCQCMGLTQPMCIHTCTHIHTHIHAYTGTQSHWLPHMYTHSHSCIHWRSVPWFPHIPRTYVTSAERDLESHLTSAPHSASRFCSLRTEPKLSI